MMRCPGALFLVVPLDLLAISLKILFNHPPPTAVIHPRDEVYGGMRSLVYHPTHIARPAFHCGILSLRYWHFPVNSFGFSKFSLVGQHAVWKICAFLNAKCLLAKAKGWRNKHCLLLRISSSVC